MIKWILFLALPILATSCAAQPKTIPASEVQLMNYSESKVSFRGSLNKKDWTDAFVNKDSQISLTIPRGAEFFFVELCQLQKTSQVTVCDTFQLKPRYRYFIEFNKEVEKLVIQMGRPSKP